MDHHDIKNFEFLKTYLEPGDVLVDIGANYGDYTDFYLQTLNSNCKIYSFELDKSTTDTLIKRFNDYSNVNIFNKAVSNKNETIDYYKGRDAWTNNILGHDTNFNPNEVAGKVESIRLDTFFENIDFIKLIKIDVEGAETKVLEGMENMFHKIKYILLECHFEKDWKFISDLLMNKKNFMCLNIETMKKVNIQSEMPYQCFCINKKLV